MSVQPADVLGEYVCPDAANPEIDHMRSLALRLGNVPTCTHMRHTNALRTQVLGFVESRQCLSLLECGALASQRHSKSGGALCGVLILHDGPLPNEARLHAIDHHPADLGRPFVLRDQWHCLVLAHCRM